MTGFPDVEALLVDNLDDLGSTGIETPSDLQDHLPFIRVRRVGGGSAGRNDRPRVEIDVFAATRGQGWPITSAIRERLELGFPLPAVDRFTVEVGPQELPWDDQGVRRWLTAYTAVMRRPS